MTPVPWRVAGSYFEVCNCDAICPCRRRNGQKVTFGSTYGFCEFALSWQIREGSYGDRPLAGFAAVLAGAYRDDEPGKPWRVCLYVDARADAAQQLALSEIFTGRSGGTPFDNYAKAIVEVYVVRPATIDLDHRPRRWSIRADRYVTVRASEPVASAEAITCGIPGHGQPGEEVRAEMMRLEDPPLRIEVEGRCGFASHFDYRSDS